MLFLHFNYIFFCITCSTPRKTKERKNSTFGPGSLEITEDTVVEFGKKYVLVVYFIFI